MPLNFGWMRTQASKRGGHRPDAEERLAKGQGSLASGCKDTQDESARSGGGSKSVVIRPAPAHAASPVVSLNSKPSLLRKTLSTLSMKGTPKASQGSGAVTGVVEAPANGNRSIESATGIKPSEVHATAEGDSVKKAATGHSFLPRFHGLHHQQSHANSAMAHDGSADHGVHSSHTFHFPHIHLPHILDSKSHHPVPHPDILHGMENRIEVMRVLEEATERAKKIIENARGERENLMQRARVEAEEEMAELRHSLEQEALAQQGEEAAVAESLRLATLKEDTRTHELLETSQENITASVADLQMTPLCLVDATHLADDTIVPSRRDSSCHTEEGAESARGLVHRSSPVFISTLQTGAAFFCVDKFKKLALRICVTATVCRICADRRHDTDKRAFRKNNPPSFLRKSQASKFPSVRNDLAARRTGQKTNFMTLEHSWDADPRDFPPATSTTDAQADVYSQILGGRQYSDEDEFRIDFNELEAPPPLRQLSSVMQRLQNSCGCFFG